MCDSDMKEAGFPTYEAPAEKKGKASKKEVSEEEAPAKEAPDTETKED